MKGIIFDLDHTLVYPRFEFEQVFEKFFSIPYSAVSDKWLGAIYNHPSGKGCDQPDPGSWPVPPEQRNHSSFGQRPWHGTGTGG